MRFQCSHCSGVLEIFDCEPGEAVACGHCESAVTVPDTRLSPRAIVGDFVIKEELGRGGMGIVYLAHQISLDREAALKILSGNHAEDEHFIASFLREARTAASLNHPNMVQAYAVGSDEGIHYFAMEYIKGSTLKEVLTHSGRMVPERAVEIVTQVAMALQHAWEQKKLVHRDIKPDNVMLTVDGKVKLADLGLARWAGDGSETSGEIYGTPQYISPEQMLGKQADTRSDIYSLGATFYQALSGSFPYSGRAPSEIAEKHLLEPLTPLAELVANLPEALCNIVANMMAKRPAHRYPDAQALLVDLERFHNGEEVALVVPYEQMQQPVDMNEDFDDGVAGGETSPPVENAALKKSVPKKKGGLKLKKNAAADGASSDVPPPVVTDGDGPPVGVALGEPANPELENDDAQSDVPESGLAEGEEEASSKSLMVPIIAAILLVLLLGGGAAFFLLQRGGDSEKQAGPGSVASADALSEIRTMIQNQAPEAEIVAKLKTMAEGMDASAVTADFWVLANPYLEKDFEHFRSQRHTEEVEKWQKESEQLLAEQKEKAEQLKREQEEKEAEAARLAEEKAIAEKAAAEKAKLVERMEVLRWRAFARCYRHEYIDAGELFTPLTDTKDEEVAQWARDKREACRLAQRLFARIRNSKKAFAGAKFPSGSRTEWEVYYISGRRIETRRKVTKHREGGEAYKKTFKLNILLDEIYPIHIYRLLQFLKSKDETVDAAALAREFGAYLALRGEQLAEARKQIAAGGGNEALLAELEVMAPEFAARREPLVLEDLKAVVQEGDKEKIKAKITYLQHRYPALVRQHAETIKQMLNQ